MATIHKLTDITPNVAAEALLDGMHPSYRFGEVSFDTYIPDPSQPSQAAAVKRLQEFAEAVNADASPSKGLMKLFGKKKKAKGPAGIYLDGGFGVGKTHLLASLWHATEGKRAFGTFVEYTNLVGALTFPRAVEILKTYNLVCIDEFELDDPGDTVLMSRLMRELADAGVKLAATSNTLPGALGEGRFAAQDFQREIQVLADQFEIIRVDGEDSVTVVSLTLQSRWLTVSCCRLLRNVTRMLTSLRMTSRSLWITCLRFTRRVTASF